MVTDLLPGLISAPYCDLGNPCVRDEPPEAQEKHFVISDDEKEELSLTINRVTEVNAESSTL